MISDPYIGTERCVQRLVQEWRVHKKLIVALDFDDTVFDFHKKGFAYIEVIELAKRCQALGFYVVLFTGSHPDTWEGNKMYLAMQGLHVNYVNENPIPLPFGKHGKMYYNILLDDRAGLGQAVEILNEALNRIEKEATQ